MQVDDDGEEGGELIHFSEEDIRDYVGEMERPRVFADTLQALVQQADEPLSGRWESKLQEKKNGSRGVAAIVRQSNKVHHSLFIYLSYFGHCRAQKDFTTSSSTAVIPLLCPMKGWALRTSHPRNGRRDIPPHRRNAGGGRRGESPLCAAV